MLKYIVHALLWIAIKVNEIIYFPKLIFMLCTKPKRVPPIEDSILLSSARELSERIRGKRLSSEQVVTSYINRVKAVNPVINGMVENRFEAALEEAKMVDQYLRETLLPSEQIAERFPLLGVPMTVKESIGVEGMSCNAGKVRGRSNAPQDAIPVKSLKSAGVIVILVSNTPEMCVNWECDNSYTGVTKNPYDTRRTSGGSSGGEAALLGTAGSVIGLGSDMVGSLRVPPAFCGIYGHKPSPYVVPCGLHTPPMNNDMADFYLTLGPLTRYACDLPLLMSIIVKPESKTILKLDETVTISKIKLFVMYGVKGGGLTNHVDEEIITAMQRVVKQLKERIGLNTKEIFIKQMYNAIDFSFVTLLSVENVGTIFTGGHYNIFTEIIRTMLCLSRVGIMSILYVILHKLVCWLVSEDRLNRLKTEIEQLRQKMETLLGENGVLLYPVFPNVAHFHGRILSRALDTAYLAIFNSLGLPVTVCPIGMHSKGVPIAMQIVAARNNDRLTMTLAQEIESLGLGGWIAPSPKLNNSEV